MTDFVRKLACSILCRSCSTIIMWPDDSGITFEYCPYCKGVPEYGPFPHINTRMVIVYEGPVAVSVDDIVITMGTN